MTDRRAHWLTLSVAVALAAALFMTWPAWLHPGSAVIGNWHDPDMISNHWLYLWVRDRVLGGESLLHNDSYYFPVGDAPWLAGNGNDALTWLLIGSWMPWPASLTAWMLLGVTLNGVAGATLARVLGAGRAGVVVAAALVACCPYVAQEMSAARFAQVSLYWLLFFLAAWVRLLERPTWRRAVVAALLFGATSVTYWYYGLWVAMAGALLWAFRPSLRALVRFVPIALATTLPPLAVFVSHWADIPGTTDAHYPNKIAVDTSLFATFPVWGGGSLKAHVLLPLVLPLLAVAGLRRKLWPHGALVAVAAVFYLLCLGPFVLAPSGEPTAVHGLYWPLYAWLGLLRRFWWPYRHIVVFMAALLPLAAFGADALVARLGRRAIVVLVALLLLTPVELSLRGARVQTPVSSWSPPEIYEKFDPLPAGGIIELPLHPQVAITQPALSYQWVHGRRMVNGHAMWVDWVRPDEWDDFVKANSLLYALQAAEIGSRRTLRIRPEDVRGLVAMGVRLVVLNAEFYPARMRKMALTECEVLGRLFGSPLLIEEDQLWVWDLARYDGERVVRISRHPPPDRFLAKEGGVLPTVLAATSRGWSLVGEERPPDTRLFCPTQ